MEALYERCCGLDVHKASITACVLIKVDKGKVRKQMRRFSAMTAVYAIEHALSRGTKSFLLSIVLNTPPPHPYPLRRQCFIGLVFCHARQIPPSEVS